MASYFAWLDHRPDDAQRVREAMRALEQPGTVDPLGLGSVRDAFSDLLFPGLSTVMTRARYFLFVPWVFQEVDRTTRNARSAASKSRELEVQLISALLAGSDGDHTGIIGQNSRDRTKQLPSTTYWGGLGTLGIRQFNGSRLDYYGSVGSPRRDDPWHPSLRHIDRPGDWLNQATLDLTAEEAGFLRDRILTSAPRTLFSVLARDATEVAENGLPWDHPLTTSAPPDIRDQVDHARLFAIAMWGAGLLYNMNLEKMRSVDLGYERSQSEVLTENFHTWQAWVSDIHHDLHIWNRAGMWSTVEARAGSTRQSRPFINWWLDRVIDTGGIAIDTPDTRRRIRDQELAVKGPRAKLSFRRAREQSEGLSGDALMTFRWNTASNVLDDIIRATV